MFTIKPLSTYDSMFPTYLVVTPCLICHEQITKHLALIHFIDEAPILGTKEQHTKHLALIYVID